MNQKIIIIIILIAVGLGLVWVTKKPAAQTKPENLSTTANNSIVKLVSPQEFATLAKDSTAFIVDVHTPEQTHIPGTDAFIPYDQIRENADKLPADKSTPILVYCRSGSMSETAAKEIAALGYTAVYDLDGGTDVYNRAKN